MFWAMLRNVIAIYFDFCGSYIFLKNLYSYIIKSMFLEWENKFNFSYKLICLNICRDVIQLNLQVSEAAKSFERVASIPCSQADGGWLQGYVSTVGIDG
jgi:hypothetical protein